MALPPHKPPSPWASARARRSMRLGASCQRGDVSLSRGRASSQHVCSQPQNSAQAHAMAPSRDGRPLPRSGRIGRSGAPPAAKRSLPSQYSLLLLCVWLHCRARTVTRPLRPLAPPASLIISTDPRPTSCNGQRNATWTRGVGVCIETGSKTSGSGSVSKRAPPDPFRNHFEADSSREARFREGRQSVSQQIHTSTYFCLDRFLQQQHSAPWSIERMATTPNINTR
eukprot:7385073-Prymnesium_polylepis.1